MKKAYLALADGTVFEGRSFGLAGKALGEVVFTTGMTGYQETLTDPTFCGQILVMTYPLIGNYGTNKRHFESSKVWVEGLVVSEACPAPNHYLSRNDISKYLEERGIVGIEGIDTRALTRRIRDKGNVRGVITTEQLSKEELVAEAQKAQLVSDLNLISRVTTSRTYSLPGNSTRIVLMDFGVKQSIIRQLQQRGCTVTVVPAHTSAEEIMSYRPQGIFLSNGPGDPKNVEYAVKTIRELAGRIPIFGICMGHQLLGLAFGAQSYKLPFGHRGSNHPVKELATGRVFITSQNHGFALDKDSLPADELELTHINLNDGSVEGMRHKHLPIFSVQFHPEGSPGPKDSVQLFDRFIELVSA